jgi:hypothetical protein
MALTMKDVQLIPSPVHTKKKTRVTIVDVWDETETHIWDAVKHVIPWLYAEYPQFDEFVPLTPGLLSYTLWGIFI